MSVWLEIHCDALLDGSTKCGEPSCWAKSGNQPGAMADNANVMDVLSRLRREAKAKGFRLKRDVGWVCPSCLAGPLPAVLPYAGEGE